MSDVENKEQQPVEPESTTKTISTMRRIAKWAIWLGVITFLYYGCQPAPKKPIDPGLTAHPERFVPDQYSKSMLICALFIESTDGVGFYKQYEANIGEYISTYAHEASRYYNRVNGHGALMAWIGTNYGSQWYQTEIKDYLNYTLNGPNGLLRMSSDAFSHVAVGMIKTCDEKVSAEFERRTRM